MALPVERRRAVVREQLARILLVDGFGELARFSEIRFRRLEPEHVGIRRIGTRSRDRRLDPVADDKEPFGRALPRTPAAIVLVAVARQQSGAVRVRAGDEYRVHAADVGSESRGGQLRDELARRHQHLAAEMAALFYRRELILEVHAGGAGRDHLLHQLVRVEDTAEAGFRISHQRHVPLDRMIAVHVVDFVGAPQRILNAADQVGHAIGRVQALVGIHSQRAVRVGRDLPAADVDRLETGADFLHRLVPRDGRQRRHIRFLAHQFPESRGTVTCQRVLHRERTAQTVDIFGRVGAPDALPPSLAAPPHVELRHKSPSVDAAVLPAVSRDVHTPPP